MNVTLYHQLLANTDVQDDDLGMGQNNIDMLCYQAELFSHQLFFLQGKAQKEIHAILIETLGEHAPSYATVKNWVAQFKCDDFSTCDASRPG